MRSTVSTRTFSVTPEAKGNDRCRPLWGHDEVGRFIRAVRLAGAHGFRFAAVGTVPLFADDLVRLLAYPNARVPAGWGEAMSGAFPTPGSDLATALCRRLLRVDGLDGVLLGATCGPEHAAAAADAFIDGQLRG